MLRERNTDYLPGDFDITIAGGLPEKSFLDKVVDSVDKITSIPGRLEQTSTRLNDSLRNALTNVKDRSADRVESNIKQQTITGYFSKFGRWIQQGNNLWYVAGGLILTFWILRR